MISKIFLLGATGYIGGDAVFALTNAHPEYEISCLVRNSEKGADIASQYSKIKLVYGTLDDTDVLRQEAMLADVVVNCAHADHGKAVSALIEGLGSKAKGRPSHYIHTSGTGILVFADMDRKILGEPSSKIYDDWEGIGEVVSLPDHASHRLVDKIVIGADSSHVRTAIVCPPTIYGPGRGPGNQRSHQVPEMARCTLERKQAFKVGPGKNAWSIVQVHDLSDLFVKLVEAAVQGETKATWGPEGYYFAENGGHVWGTTAEKIASIAHKQELIPSAHVEVVSESKADELTRAGAALWGANSKCHGLRARQVLDWSPKHQDFDADIFEVVSQEARTLGLSSGHAAKVTR